MSNQRRMPIEEEKFSTILNPWSLDVERNIGFSCTIYVPPGRGVTPGGDGGDVSPPKV